jgi:hypothetical protein
MPFISDAQVSRVQSTIGNLAAKANRAKQAAQKQADNMMKVAEIVGAGAAIGFVRGKMEKTGDFNIPGTQIDIELAVGLGLTGASLFEVFGKWDDDALNVGSGVLAHYAGQVFRNWGKTDSFALVAGHNYPHAPAGGAASIGLAQGGAARDLIGAGGMSSALQSALSASV